MDWVELNLNQAITSRVSNFNLLKSNKTKIGNNLLSTRLTILNKKVKLDDLNMSLDSFKIKYKKILLQQIKPWKTNQPLSYLSLLTIQVGKVLSYSSNSIMYFVPRIPFKSAIISFILSWIDSFILNFYM